MSVRIDDFHAASFCAACEAMILVHNN